VQKGIGSFQCLSTCQMLSPVATANVGCATRCKDDAFAAATKDRRRTSQTGLFSKDERRGDIYHSSVWSPRLVRVLVPVEAMHKDTGICESSITVPHCTVEGPPLEASVYPLTGCTRRRHGGRGEAGIRWWWWWWWW